MMLHDVTDRQSTRLPLVHPLFAIVVHHCSLKTIGYPDEVLDGAALARAFELRQDLGTGLCRPYHAVIRRDGTVDQCIALSRRGAHALTYNVNTLAVATVGEDGLNAEQRQALIEVLADWLMLTEGIEVSGHTALGPNATRPGHPQCPHITTNVAELTKWALAFHGPEICQGTESQRMDAIRRRGWVI